ncbi:MAG: 2-C-methyl-D-erythritol 2,4-cyclodiphosphate synthase [Eubacteriales bacterium]|nr:2-C-methyl-D-erythritol 2,4-cyclodiphosphate synthase [Eubacteriales bacterium]
MFIYVSSLGQDSHRFVDEAGPAGTSERVLMLGGVAIPGAPALDGNSDADVILHAVANAVSGLTGVNILGSRADALCRAGITDSVVYLQEAMSELGDWQLLHCSLSLEGCRPKLAPYIADIRRRLAELLGLEIRQIGLTATSGEALTAFGRGEGIQVFCTLSARRPDTTGPE